MAEWISVKDRLPELKDVGWRKESDFVLCANIPNGGHMRAPKIWIFYLQQLKTDKFPKWAFIGENSPGIVSHWMPLPRPPPPESAT